MEHSGAVISFLSKLFPQFLFYYSKTNRNARKLAVVWEYECILTQGVFIGDHDGILRNAHGGTCTVEIIHSKLTTKVEISGNRTWVANIKENGDKTDYLVLANSKPWSSIEGSFITDSRIMYKYKINENMTGITFLDLGFNPNTKKLNPSGTFLYFLPISDKLIGKNIGEDLFNRILNSKEKVNSNEMEIFTGLNSYGNVRFIQSNP